MQWADRIPLLERLTLAVPVHDRTRRVRRCGARCGGVPRPPSAPARAMGAVRSSLPRSSCRTRSCSGATRDERPLLRADAPGGGGVSAAVAIGGRACRRPADRPACRRRRSSASPRSWALAFVAGVYGHEHTRVTGVRAGSTNTSRPGSVLSVESWDDGLPLVRRGRRPRSLRVRAARAVGSRQRRQGRATSPTQLGGIDYVVETSPRVWNVGDARLPGRYPSTIRFFEALDDGSLGFERVATITSPPRLGPFRLDTTSAEEAFSVYDHPEVRIWQKVETLTTDELFAALDPVAAANALPIPARVRRAGGAMLTHEERAENASARDVRRDVRSRRQRLVHALGWLVVLEFVGWSTFVLLLPVLRRLPDAGAGLSKVARARPHDVRRLRRGDVARAHAQSRASSPPSSRRGWPPARRRVATTPAASSRCGPNAGSSCCRPRSCRCSGSSPRAAASCQPRPVALVAQRREAVRAGDVHVGAAHPHAAAVRRVVRGRGAQLLLRRLPAAVDPGSHPAHCAVARDEPGRRRHRQPVGRRRLLGWRGGGRGGDGERGRPTGPAGGTARGAVRAPRAERRDRAACAAPARRRRARRSRLVEPQPGDPELAWRSPSSRRGRCCSPTCTRTSSTSPWWPHCSLSRSPGTARSRDGPAWRTIVLAGDRRRARRRRAGDQHVGLPARRAPPRRATLVATVVLDRARWRTVVAAGAVAAGFVVVGWGPYVARTRGDRHDASKSTIATRRSVVGAAVRILRDRHHRRAGARRPEVPCASCGRGRGGGRSSLRWSLCRWRCVAAVDRRAGLHGGRGVGGVRTRRAGVTALARPSPGVAARRRDRLGNRRSRSRSSASSTTPTG